MSSSSKGNSIQLSRRYSAALREQLTLKRGATSRPAESFGREAVAVGLDALDLLRIHQRALIVMLPPGPSSTNNNDGMIKRAARFLVEALTPIEHAHRTALKTNGVWSAARGHAPADRRAGGRARS
jgi:hypothetical protein